MSAEELITEDDAFSGDNGRTGKKGGLDWMKRIAAFGMAMVMAASMSGCGKGSQSGGGGSSDTANLDTKDMVYAAKEIRFEGIQGEINAYTIKDDKIYFTTYEWFENGVSGSEGGADTEPGDDENSAAEPGDDADNAAEPGDDADNAAEPEDDADATDIEYTSVYRLYSANLDGTNAAELPFSIGDNEGIQFMAVNNDGNLQLLIANRQAEIAKYAMVTLDAGGKELSRKELADALKLGTEEYLSKVLMDKEGNLCFVKESSISVLDKDGKLLQEIKVDNNTWMEGAAMTKDGALIYGCSDEEGAKVQSVDPKTGQKGDVYAVDLKYFNSSESLMNGVDGYDFYYQDDSGIYGYSIADKKSKKLLDYAASDMSGNSPYMVPVAGDRFVAMVYDYDKGGTSSLCIYSKADPSQVVEKTLVTYGGTYISEEIKQAAMEFNKTSDKYKIVFQDYSHEEDPDTKFNADIAAGKVPDIIDLSAGSINQYASVGLLEDLTPYYEKDADVKLDDILDNVVDAMKINDKIYYVAPCFSLNTIIAKKSDVGDKTGWTLKEMQELIQSKAPDARPFLYSDKGNMMRDLLSQSISEFVNWETGECSFESEEFKETLELCNTGTSGEPDYENTPNHAKELQSGNVYLETAAIEFESVEFYERAFGGDITFIGYPSEERQGSYFLFEMPLGIYSKSEVKDAAWEFLKTIMGREFQYNNLYWFGAPTRKDIFEMEIKKVTATEPYMDEMGEEIKPLNASWSMEGLDVLIGPLNESRMALYMELLESVHKVSNNNDVIMHIIQEEVQAYFAGEKSVDETAKLIQNRVSTYVNERR